MYTSIYTLIYSVPLANLDLIIVSIFHPRITQLRVFYGKYSVSENVNIESSTRKTCNHFYLHITLFQQSPGGWKESR